MCNCRAEAFDATPHCYDCEISLPVGQLIAFGVGSTPPNRQNLLSFGSSGSAIVCTHRQVLQTARPHTVCSRNGQLLRGPQAFRGAASRARSSAHCNA